MAHRCRRLPRKTPECFPPHRSGGQDNHGRTTVAVVEHRRHLEGKGIGWLQNKGAIRFPVLRSSWLDGGLHGMWDGVPDGSVA